MQKGLRHPSMHHRCLNRIDDTQKKKRIKISLLSGGCVKKCGVFFRLFGGEISSVFFVIVWPTQMAQVGGRGMEAPT
jgi:hypothetical protein